ncbi:hypothetical protein DPMN_179729 [Dreissena polymorpha]|uniref:Uncharacterized protein n=1 Tax=Dreissena polymorpha TaxID=45954 RepID=A0A9D4EFL8_DREPO|nr:hypothetical protein DPMN_179729 [Dreissena polymorpha]
MTKSDITDNQGLWFIKEIIARVHNVSMDICPQVGNRTTTIRFVIHWSTNNSAKDGPKSALKKEEGWAWSKLPHPVKKCLLRKRQQGNKRQTEPGVKQTRQLD